MDYLTNNIKIEQDKDGYHFSSDAINLGNFVKPKQSDTIIDIGCGSGVLSLMACTVVATICSHSALLCATVLFAKIPMRKIMITMLLCLLWDLSFFMIFIVYFCSLTTATIPPPPPQLRVMSISMLRGWLCSITPKPAKICSICARGSCVNSTNVWVTLCIWAATCCANTNN